MYIVTPRDVLRIQEILRITYLVRSLSCSRPSRARSRCVRPDVAVSSSSRRSSCRTTPRRQRAHPSAGSSWPCRACGPRGTGRSSLGSGTSERYRSKQSGQRNKREVQVEAVWAVKQITPILNFKALKCTCMYVMDCIFNASVIWWAAAFTYLYCLCIRDQGI